MNTATNATDSRTSDARAAANKANAQLSTGPTSPEGKATSSKNALKTGLTGRTVLLPTDDAALYEAHLTHVFARFSPVGPDELNLVQSIADNDWRLARIPALESAIYALGAAEFADLFPDHDESARRHLIHARTFITYQRQLNNLSIQEGRLRRHREQDIAALRQLQDARARERRARLDDAAWTYITAIDLGEQDGFDPAARGFEFSIDEIEVRAMKLDPNLFAEYESNLLKKRAS